MSKRGTPNIDRNKKPQKKQKVNYGRPNVLTRSQRIAQNILNNPNAGIGDIGAAYDEESQPLNIVIDMDESQPLNIVVDMDQFNGEGIIEEMPGPEEVQIADIPVYGVTTLEEIISFSSKQAIWYRATKNLGRIGTTYQRLAEAFNTLHTAGHEGLEQRFLPDVIATKLNLCLEDVNFSHEFRGKFHCIALLHKRFFFETVEPFHKHLVLQAFSTTFNIMTIHNTSFATLSVALNANDNTLINHPFAWGVYVSGLLAESGAVAGYDVKTLYHKFSRVVFYFSCSTSSFQSLDEMQENNTSIHFFTFKSKPVDIYRFFSNDDKLTNAENEAIMVQLIIDLETEWENKMQEFLEHYDGDKQDLDPMDERIQRLRHRAYTVSVKFLPKVIFNKPPLMLEYPNMHTSYSIKKGENLRPIGITDERRDTKLKSSLWRNPLSDQKRDGGYRIIDEEFLVSKEIQVQNNGEYVEKMKEQLTDFEDYIGESDLNMNKYIVDRDLENEARKILRDENRPSNYKDTFEQTVDINILTTDKEGAIEFREKLYDFPQRGNREELINEKDQQVIEGQTAKERYENEQRRLQADFDEQAKAHNEREADVNDWFEGDIFGCVIDKNKKLEASLARMKPIWTPPNISDTNCLLRCLLQNRREDLNQDFIKLRSDAEIDHQLHLGPPDIQKLSEYYNTIIILYSIVETKYSDKTLALQLDAEESRISHKILKHSAFQPERKDLNRHFPSSLHILVHHEHAYLLLDKDLVLKKVKCSICTQWINRSNFFAHCQTCFYCQTCRKPYHKKDHKCLNSTQVYLNKGELKQRAEDQEKEIVCDAWTNMRAATKGKKISTPNKIWFADIEAYPDPFDENRFIPYAIGLSCFKDLEKEQPIIFYGQDCMEEYLKYVTEKVKGTLYYFNGSGFDNFLHLKGMIDHGIEISNNGFVKARGRILSFNHNSQVKVHDLALFLSGSLDSCCKAWGVPQDLSKKSFDHTKVFDYESAMKHEKEVTEYLKFDVISLGTLFGIYQSTMWKCFSMDMNICITPAQFAIKVWGADNDLLPEIYIPHRGKEEDDDRAAYYGGRVMCQRKEFISNDWVDNEEEPQNYDDIEDYLILGDVNSLYPAAQMKYEYAYGKWKYISPAEGDILNYLNRFNTDKNWVKRCCFLIDVTCPKDILTSFLMERDSRGMLVHTLYDKVKQWYWGPELEEALILGYKVTKIYEIKEFEKLAPLFSSYVKTCWEGRQKSPSGSSRNLAFKFAMNSLTGKFGQKSHPTSNAIYSTEFKPTKRSEESFSKLMGKVVDFEPIFSDNGNNNAIILEFENENKGPSYPIYLSAQILAYARVIMSTIMRDCDSYRDPNKAIYYTDTDSLVMTPQCIPDLLAKNHLGNELGQIKCDLFKGFTGTNFAKIVKAIWGATKGPYSLVFMNPGDRTVYEKVKIKGIPHPDKTFKYWSNEQTMINDNEKEIFKCMQDYLDNPSTFLANPRVIGKRFYMFKYDDRVMFSDHIDYCMIKKMLKKEGEIHAFYGGMKKQFTTTSGSVLLIRPDIVRRQVGKTNWWEKNKRIYLPNHDGDTDLSYPPGYNNI